MANIAKPYQTSRKLWMIWLYTGHKCFAVDFHWAPSVYIQRCGSNRRWDTILGFFARRVIRIYTVYVLVKREDCVEIVGRQTEVNTSRYGIPDILPQSVADAFEKI